jgi:hypothetical protein
MSPRLRSIHLAMLVSICAPATACDDNSGSGAQTTAVVQETNVPCDPTTCACDREFVYYDQVTRECDGMLARISVCSEVAVCESVLAALAAQVTTCGDPGSPFAVDTTACEP